MERMSEQTRREWMHGTQRQAAVISDRISRRDFQCDHCDAPAVTIGHRGEGSTPNVTCSACFKAMLAAERATRPSAAELLARVNRAAGIA